MPAVNVALADAIDLQRERLRRASSDRLEAYLYTYLGDLFFAEPGDFHRQLYRDAEDLLWERPIGGRVRKSAAFACPRNHGKSSVMVLGVALWVSCHWRQMPHFYDEAAGAHRAPYIVVVSDTIEQAKQRLADIRDQLEQNEEIIRDFGDLAPRLVETTHVRRRRYGRRRRGRRQKWTETHLELSNGVIIRAMAFRSKVRGLVRGGRRPTLILGDDMENDEAVETKGRREKLRRWFLRALLPIGKAGQLLTIVVGTILHADSLLAKFLKEDEYTGWLKRRYAARYNAAGDPDPHGKIILWPEYWSAADLDLRRDEMGSVAFAQEYLNLPLDDDSRIFRRAWLEHAKARGKGRRWARSPPRRIPFDVVTSTWDPWALAEKVNDAGAYQVVVTAWDLALVDDERTAKERDSDYVVGITVGLTQSEELEVLRIYRNRGITPATLRAAVINEQAVVGADYVVIETNAAQRVYEIDLRKTTDLPLVPHVTDRRKHSLWEGVPSLALALETGRMIFRHAEGLETKRIDALIEEMYDLGAAAHDDILMALWMATVVVRRWSRVRDRRRRKMLGDPSEGVFLSPFPQRFEQEAA